MLHNFSYGAFGDGGRPQSFGYTGRWGGYADERLGQVLNWHRWYGPTAGRWGSRDPFGIEGGTSIYVYTLNNPIRHTDPFGLITLKECASQIAGALKAFHENYLKMRSANTIGADHYYHCMANCQASRLGPCAKKVAEDLSNLREFLDEHFKGYPAWDCALDQAANAEGRYVNPTKECSDVCGSRRPPTLPRNLW